MKSFHVRLGAVVAAVTIVAGCGRTELDPATPIDIELPDAAAPRDGRDAAASLDVAEPRDVRDDADGLACVAGATVPCVGPGGCQGTRTCANDAGFGACYCRSDCAPGTGLIYLLSTGRVLYTFDPASLTLVEVGLLTCSISPNSMAVDRHGTAWVVSLEGNLYEVDISNAACTPVTLVPDRIVLSRFGMGFVSDAPGSAAETLYVGTAVGLGKIDTTTLHLTLVGNWDIGVAELTGTADARLFAFTNPPLLAEIDPRSAAVLSRTPLPNVGFFSSFAMAFWGGDFWLFTDSRVNRYRPSDGTTTQVMSNLGVSILGAGVSTCSPSQ
jgi:hypothetical protein